MKKWSEFCSNDYLHRNIPKDVFLVRGMLSQGEIKALYTAAADFFCGSGKIVDAGAFAGLSAHCFAAGLAENSGLFTRERIIHSYDKFKATEEYTRLFIENIFYTSRAADGRVLNVEHKVLPGEEFLNIYWHQNQKFTLMLDVHQGDFHLQRWSGEPIEILFVDVCKTKSLQDHLYREYLTSLIPGESILIHQDYNHPWHPYIHLSMEVLKPCVDILVKSESASRFYLYKNAPSKALLDQALSLDFDAGQINDIFKGIIAEASDHHKNLMRVTNVQALRSYEYHDEAGAMAAVLEKEFSPEFSKLWQRILNPL